MNYYIALMLLIALVFLVTLLYWLYLYLVTDGRYHLYKKLPFPARYKDLLLRYFPLYAKLPRDLKPNFHACILTFLKEKEFKGVQVEIDETKKLLVAANACLLSMGLNRCAYKHVKTIILYPETIVKKERIQQGYVVSEELQELLGEAWQSGAVVLSWRDLLAGDLNPNDGKNVGLHEFAHQLDMEDGIADGTPELPLKLYPIWSKVMKKEYDHIKRLYEKGKRSVLDRYAITNAAEFFAVATEVFFEKPKKLKKAEPELYELLRSYYHLDPASWG